MAHPVDEHVGARIRAIRKTAGLSQEALARQVGISFQQLQKYERGSNRVSASKLFELSEILCVDISVMFEGLRIGASRAENPLLVRISADEELRKLVALYERLPSDDERRRLVRAFEVFAGPAR